MIVDMISDLHGHYPKLEGGDLLIVAGDLTATDSENDWCNFEIWICNQKYKEKIIISGNHDNFLQSMDEHRMCRYWDKVGVTYLCDSGTEFTYYPRLHPSEEGQVLERKTYKIWGIPWTPRFLGMNPKCMAFTYYDEEWYKDEVLGKIPDDVDILISHGPGWGMHDTNIYVERCGSKSLTKWIGDHVNTLKLFVCGHIHEDYGIYDIRKIQDRFDDMYTPILVNCSHVNEKYQPVNKPVRVIL